MYDERDERGEGEKKKPTEVILFAAVEASSKESKKNGSKRAGACAA
jgi:hypothetical protein